MSVAKEVTGVLIDIPLHVQYMRISHVHIVRKEAMFCNN